MVSDLETVLEIQLGSVDQVCDRSFLMSTDVKLAKQCGQS